MSTALALLTLLLAADNGPPSPELQSTMRLGFAAVTRLQPYVVSPPAFRDPAHLAEIKANLDVLARVEHTVAQGRHGPGARAIAHLFDRQVGRARYEVNSGQFEAARVRLSGLTALCLGCHQRQPADLDFTDAAQVVERLNLSPLERAEFFAATRQFDRALEAWDQELWKQPGNDVEAMDQVRALRSALGVAVRNKDDPRTTLTLLSAVAGRKELPGFVRQSIDRWADDARGWRAEKLEAASLAPRHAVDRARQLLAGSRALQTVVVDDGYLVSHLRAAGYLERALAQGGAAPWRAEALYLLGIATAAISEPSLWELDAVYFEACIREAPHSAQARQCAQRLAERINLAYTTPNGRLDVPGDVGAHLGELRALAR